MEHHGRPWLTKMRSLDLVFHKCNVLWLMGYQTLQFKWRSIDGKVQCKLLFMATKYWRPKYIDIEFSVSVYSELVKDIKEHSYTETQSRHWIHAKHDINQYSTLTRNFILLPPMVIQHQRHRLLKAWYSHILYSHISLVKQDELVALASIPRTYFSTYPRKYVAFNTLLIMANVPLICLLNVSHHLNCTK